MMILTAIIAAATALLTALATLAAAWQKIQKAFPSYKRSRMKLAIVADESRDADARKLAADWRRMGFKPMLTREEDTCLGCAVIVLLCPDEDTVRSTRRFFPEAVILVMTYRRLDIKMDDDTLLSQSPRRLRTDLLGLAEEIQ